MPTRRRPTAREPAELEDDDQVGDGAVDETLPESAADRVAQLLGSVEGDERAKVAIRKVIGPGKFGYCADLAPDEYERGGVALLRSRWGPGEYRVTLYGTTRGKGGKPGYGMRASETITIVPDQAAGAPSGAAASDTARILEAVLTRLDQVAMQQQQRPGFDLLEQLPKFLPVLQALRELGVIGGRAAAAPNPVDQVQQLLQMRKLMKELEGDGGGAGDDNTALASKLMDVILQSRGGTPAPTPTMPPVAMPPAIAAAPRPAAAAPGQPPNGANEVPLSPEQEEIARLNGLMAQALSMAQQGADIEETADLLYQELPDEIIEIMRTPNWWPMLLHIQPQLEPLQDYVTKVRDKVVEWIDDDARVDAEIAAGKGGSETGSLPAANGPTPAPASSSSSSKPAAKATKAKRA